MSSRLIFDLTARCEKKARLFLDKCKENGLPVFITCTARTFVEQMALYAQGRQSLDEVNALRKKAGMSPITAKENKDQVTWTMNSRHIIHLEDIDKSNDKCDAFDIGFSNSGALTYDIKQVAKKEDFDTWEELGALAELCGLEWGGRWKKPDRPHFQDNGKDITWEQNRKMSTF